MQDRPTANRDPSPMNPTTPTTQLTLHHMDIFPTRVWLVDLGVLNEHIPGWIAAIEAMPDSVMSKQRTPIPHGHQAEL